MKKFYLFMAMVTFCGYVFSQTIHSNDSKQFAPKKSFINYYSKIHFINDDGGKYDRRMASHLKSSPDSISYLYDYTDVWEDSTAINGLDNLSNIEIFPDTLVKIHYLNGDFGFNNYPGIAVSVDPDAPIYKNNRIDASQPYILDTIFIPCWYFRNNTTISEINNADTLLIDVVQKQPFRNVYWGDTVNKNYGDTVFVWPICFDRNLNTSQKRFDSIADIVWATKGGTYTPAHIDRYKILLTPQTIADTFTAAFHKVAFRGFSYLYLAPHLKISPANNRNARMSVAFRFKPGYTYVEGDLFNNKNSFNMFSYEEHDSTQSSTNPKYPGSWPSYSRRDNNSSYVIPSWWDEIFSWHKTIDYEYDSEFGWLAKTWSLENHWIQFKLRGLKDSSKWQGIVENRAKPLKINQNYPNPADKYTIINYELTQPDNVTLIVTDLTGNKVMEINKGSQMPGNYTFRLNTGNLSCGMYFYTIKVNNSSLTHKLIIDR